MRMGMMRRMMLEGTTARVAGFAGAKGFAYAAVCAAMLLSGSFCAGVQGVGAGCV